MLPYTHNLVKYVFNVIQIHRAKIKEDAWLEDSFTQKAFQIRTCLNERELEIVDSAQADSSEEMIKKLNEMFCYQILPELRMSKTGHR